MIGTLLVAINQGDDMLDGEAINWVKLVLTYCVPYGVATFAGVRAKQDDIRDGTLNR